MSESVCQMIRIGDLNTQPVYGRPVNRKRVEKMAAAFDERLLGGIICGKRRYTPEEGTNVIDGSHRVEAAKLKYGPDHVLEVIVLEALTEPDEARMFRLINKDRVRPGVYEILQARLVELDPVAKALVETVTGVGLKFIPQSGSQGAASDEIVAVASAEVVFRQGRDEGVLLKDTLEILKTAWQEAFGAQAFGGHLLRGTALLLQKGRANPQRLTDRLKETTPHRVLIAGRDIHGAAGVSVALGIAQHLQITYNKGLKAQNRMTAFSPKD